MSRFEDFAKREIPLEEASKFYLGLKKEAEWTDPPDQTGQLEGMFNVQVEQVLAKLKQVITAKLRLMIAYYTYAQTIRDHGWRAFKIEFYEHAEDEQKGAEFYIKRATSLGGPVHMDDIQAIPATTNPTGILTIMARAEQEGIAAQRELRQMVGDENPMKIGIEEQLVKDQHHLDELHQMMTDPEHAELEASQAMAAPASPAPEGSPEEEASETPEEEAAEQQAMKAASMRMSLVLEKMAAEKAKPSDEELKETGRQRAVTNMAAEAHREKHRRGERVGETIGRAAGAVGGAAAGKKFIGGRSGTIAGLAAGLMAGGKAGKEVGTEHDIRKNAAMSEEAMKAFQKNRQGLKKFEKTIFEPSKFALPKKAVEESVKKADSAHIADLIHSTLNAGSKLKPSNYAHIADAPKAVAGAAKGLAPGAFSMKSLMGGGGHPALSGGFGAKLAEKIAAMRREVALLKLADDGEGQMAAPTAPDLEPINYLAAEIAGRQAQEQNESAYYREQMNQMRQEAQMMQQQLSDTQGQIQQLQDSSAQSGAQIQQALQQAQMASDEATQTAIEAVKARLGAQQLQRQILQAASQDPQALGEAAMAPPAPAPGMGMGMSPDGGQAPAEGPDAGDGQAPPEGPAGAAPSPGTAPGSAPAAGAPDMNQNAGPPPGANGQDAMPTGQYKTGGLSPAAIRLMGAVGGGALGAGSSLALGQNVPGLRNRVETLGGSQDGSFGQAAALARSKAMLAQGELAEAHPMGSAIKGGLAGALLGATAAPTIGRNMGRIAESVREIAS